MLTGRVWFGYSGEEGFGLVEAGYGWFSLDMIEERDGLVWT
jgi:hypothetical protein